jgi:hypothetical protein
MQTTPYRCTALLAMVVVNVFVVPIHIASAILTTPPHYVYIISNDPCTKPPLIIPFTSTERKSLWITLRPVVDIAMKKMVLRDVVVFDIHILKIFLMDSVIHNISPCIQIMNLPIGIFPISPRASHVHVLSRPTLVVIIPCSVLITPALPRGSHDC